MALTRRMARKRKNDELKRTEALNQMRQLKRQQDEAYAESLKKDQERDRKRRKAQEWRDEEEKKLQEQLLAQQREKEEILQQKSKLATQIPKEPPKEHPDTICLVVKLPPTGRRLERRFNKNDSMKHLYYFVFCHEESPKSFQIVANFPKRIVPCEPTVETIDPQTFAEYGFGTSEMLFVQGLEP